MLVAKPITGRILQASRDRARANKGTAAARRPTTAAYAMEIGIPAARSSVGNVNDLYALPVNSPLLTCAIRRVSVSGQSQLPPLLRTPAAYQNTAQAATIHSMRHSRRINNNTTNGNAMLGLYSSNPIASAAAVVR